jgi:membrane associated rhomboid family serine protease
LKNYLLKQLLKISFYPLCFLAIAWLVFFLDTKLHLHLTEWGTSPRTLKGLTGILFSPFLHSNLDHIASNSLPILVLGMLTFFFYKPIAWGSFLWIYFTSGVWLWVGGRNNPEGSIYHIGASGLIYGAATFLFFSGVFRRHKPLMVISALVAFLYGSMMYGIFPLMPNVSWEAHLFGAISGILVAYNYRKEGPQRKEFVWDDDEDDDDEFYKNEDPESENNDPTINYHFIPKQDEKTM